MHRMVTTDPGKMSSDGTGKTVVCCRPLCCQTYQHSGVSSRSSTGMIPGRWVQKSLCLMAAFITEVQALEPVNSSPTTGWRAETLLKETMPSSCSVYYFHLLLEGAETDTSLSARLSSSLGHVTVLLFLRHICFAGISAPCSCSRPFWWWSEEVCSTGPSTGYCYTCCGHHCCGGLCGGCGGCSHATHQETEEKAGEWSRSHHTGHAWIHGGTGFVNPFGAIQTVLDRLQEYPSQEFPSAATTRVVVYQLSFSKNHFLTSIQC